MTEAAQCAVFGSPITHSLSPRIHTAFAAQCGLALDYRAIEATRSTFAADLVQFAAAGGMGANVTLPLKTDALALCATLDAPATRAGAVNTLHWRNNAWHGYNTDGIGLVRDLTQRHQLDLAGRRMLLIGAGGAARGVLAPLQAADLGGVVIVNRTVEKAQALAAAFNSRLCPTRHAELAALPELGAFDLIVHASSAGHTAAAFALPEWPESLVKPGTVLVDLSYGSAAKPALAWASELDLVGLDGLGMLIEQAAEAFWIWHGIRPETAAVWSMLRIDA